MEENNITYNYNKLGGKIREKFGDNQTFSKKMQMSERTMSLKLNNKVDWKQKEITKACALLDISINDVQFYFFELIVQ